MAYKYRQAARVDNNQLDIVKSLRKLPGITVEVGHDDILVGYKGKTYWYEIKSPDAANKSGVVFCSKIKPDQKRILRDFTGHYKIVISLEEILDDIGFLRG